jgi:tetratricopeptide (TPR) repeat protein
MAMTRCLPIVCALSWIAMAPGIATAQSPRTDPAHRYAACMELARSDPRRGLDVAQAWQKGGGGLGARHCRAIALYELGQHVEAGKELEALAREMTGQSAALRAEILAQAGQAYQAARLGDRALAVQNAAILLDPGNAEIWIDRSITYAGVGAYREAADDLTRALTLAPKRADILELRAAAWRQLNDFKAAIADADAALRSAPQSIQALFERGMARRGLGDRVRGDADLRSVMTIAPASPLAAQARMVLVGPGTTAPATPTPRRPSDKPR